MVLIVSSSARIILTNPLQLESVAYVDILIPVRDSGFASDVTAQGAIEVTFGFWDIGRGEYFEWSDSGLGSGGKEVGDG